MPGRYSAITVVGPDESRNLALPADIPVAELLPLLLDRGLVPVGSGSDGPVGRWELVEISGARLTPSRTLADSGVGDGDLLMLRDVTDAVAPEAVEDVRDSVEDTVDGSGPRWLAKTGRTYATVVAAIAVTVAAFLPGNDLAVTLTGALMCAAAIVITWWAAPTNPLLSRLGLAAGALWAWRIAHLNTDALADGDGVAAELLRHTYGLWAAVALSLIAVIGTPVALPFVAGFATAAVIATPVAVAMYLSVDPVSAVAVAAVVFLFGIGLLPRLAMAAGGLFGLDREVRSGRTAAGTDLKVVLERVDGVLLGAVIAVAAAEGVAAVALVREKSQWTMLLAFGLGLALLTRSRMFDQARHVAPLRIAGTFALAVVGWSLLRDSAVVGPWLPAVVVLAALAFVGLAVIPRSTEANASAAQVLRWVEILLVAAMVAVAGQVLGVYAAVGW